MDCIKIKSLISEYLYDEADAESVRLVDEHIKNCEECRKIVSLNRKAISGYRAVRKPSPPASAVKAALAESRERRESEFVNRKTQRVVSLRPYLKYMKHPLFAAASLVVVVGILLTTSGKKDTGHIAQDEKAINDFALDDSNSGESAKLPPLTDVEKDQDLSDEVNALVEKASEASEIKKSAKLKIRNTKEMETPLPVVEEAEVVLKTKSAVSRKAKLEEVRGVPEEAKRVKELTEGNQEIVPEKQIKLTESVTARLDNNEDTKGTSSLMNKLEKAPAISRAAAVVGKENKEDYISLALQNEKVAGPELNAGSDFAVAKKVVGKWDKKADAVSEADADVVINDPKDAKDILKKAFELYQKHKYNDALYYLGKISDNAGDVTVAAVELEVLCHNYLENKEAVEEGLDVLTRLDPALGAHLAREIGLSRKAAAEGEKTKKLLPRSSTLEKH